MRSRALPTTFIYLFLALLALVFLYPVILMVLTAFKTTPEIFRNPFGLPEALSWKGFRDVWERAHFGLYLRNSVIITALVI
ncbi:MAG TPA: hypothetical protein PKN52_03560, partial [Trueperaceae bacterium]|nr:hypothetical protein [Trueperaceae bacterium]